MAYWIHNTGNRNNFLWRFFMCDYLSDLKNLPTQHKEGQPQSNDTICKNKCCPGSQCLCLEDGTLWLLGKDTDKWTKYKGISNEATITENIPTISHASIESLFS